MNILRRSLKFKFSGGRSGMIYVTEGDVLGQMEWELLTRDVDLVIDAGRCFWTAPTMTTMTRADVLRLAHEFANETHLRVEVAFSDGSEIVAS